MIRVLFILIFDCIVHYVVFFFKQKTAYEMRISDWSSDVCSSDLSFCHELRCPPIDVSVNSCLKQIDGWAKYSLAGAKLLRLVVACGRRCARRRGAGGDRKSVV